MVIVLLYSKLSLTHTISYNYIINMDAYTFEGVMHPINTIQWNIVRTIQIVHV